MAYSNGYYVASDGRRIGPRLPEPHQPIVCADDLLPDCCYLPIGVLVNRAVLQRVGLFDEDLRYGEDHDLWLRILEVFPAVYVPVFGFCYRLHGGQSSLNFDMWRDAERVLARLIKRYPYQSRSIRKRRAVLAYRFSEHAYRERRFVAGACLLAKAAALDPARAARELARRISGEVTRFQPRRSGD